MPRPTNDPPPEGGGPDTTRLTADQLGRWADRIAAGRDEFPAGLADSDRPLLAGAVRARLRERLVRLVARAVAERMLGGDRPAAEE